MTAILNLSTDKFSINGIPYFKNFLPHVVDDAIRIVNQYDTTFALSELQNFEKYIVEGVVYNNVADLQEALLPILFSRNNLGAVFIANGVIPFGQFMVFKRNGFGAGVPQVNDVCYGFINDDTFVGPAKYLGGGTANPDNWTGEVGDWPLV